MNIRQQVLDEMIAHAREAAPLECCGLLAGSGEVIDECVRARNARQSETAYLVDPEDHFAALRRLRRADRRILGAYHSHPRSPAVPSPTDLDEAHDPELVYVIVSLEDPAAPGVRAFEIRDRRHREVRLEVLPA